MRDCLELDFTKDVWDAISALYVLMLWELPGNPQMWTFEDACALYFRLEFHPFTVSHDAVCYIKRVILAHLEDELA